MADAPERYARLADATSGITIHQRVLRQTNGSTDSAMSPGYGVSRGAGIVGGNGTGVGDAPHAAPGVEAISSTARELRIRNP
jgi:hypothetical protein